MVKVDLIGLKDFTNRIKNASKQVQAEVSNEVAAAAAEFEAGAIKLLITQRGDTGTLAKSIGKRQETPFTWDVFASAFYAPYIEWGTITKVKVPSELSDYAIQFKGRGILKNGGIVPTPFFFPNMTPVRINMEKRIEAALNGL